MERGGLVRPGLLDSQRFYLWRGTSKFVWKFLFTPNRFHLCFVNFIWCMLQQTKKYCLHASKKCPDVCKREGKLLAYNSCVSVSLVLLMEAFLEITQRFGLDFNYQSTSSVEKHNTVWRCERSNVLTF